MFMKYFNSSLRNYAHTWVNMCVCVCIFVCVSLSIFVSGLCVCVYVGVGLCWCVCECVCVCVCSCVCSDIARFETIAVNMDFVNHLRRAQAVARVKLEANIFQNSKYIYPHSYIPT